MMLTPETLNALRNMTYNWRRDPSAPPSAEEPPKPFSLLNFQSTFSQPQQFFSPSSQPHESARKLMNEQEMEMARGLLGLKEMWHNNDRLAGIYNRQANDEKLDEEERGRAAQRRESAMQIRDQAAADASLLRGTAGAIGFNPDAYKLGSKNTWEEATQTLAKEQERGFKNLFYNYKPTSVQLAERAEELRRQNPNWSRRHAEQAAEGDRDRIRSELLGRLSDGLKMYGMNEDGALNANGVELLARMANENPEMAKLFGEATALPRDVYGRKSAYELARYNAAQQAAANDARSAANMEYLAADWAYKNEAAARAVEQQKQLEEMKAQAKKDAAALTAAEEMFKLTKGTFTGIYNELVSNGYQPEKARIMAESKFFPELYKQSEKANSHDEAINPLRLAFGLLENDLRRRCCRHWKCTKTCWMERTRSKD